MFTTCTVPELADFVAAPFSAAGLPQAASRPPAPLSAANVPAVLPMNARRVVPASPVSTICLLLPSGACSRAVDRRVVPRDQESLEHDDGEVQQEAEEGEHEDHREQRLGLQVVQARDDPIAETLVPAEVLADDGADHGEDDADLHPREDVGQGARVLQAPEGLPAARVEAAHDVAMPRIDRADPQD